jgi:DNA-binding NarL/FixJ family response regulator
MSRVRVAVRASDAITGVGLATYLESRDELDVVRSAVPLDADVLVFATDTLDGEAAESLRLVARESEVRTVLLARSFAETGLLTAVACHVVSVLPLGATIGVELVDAVLDAARLADVLPVSLLDELMGQVQRIGGDRLFSGGLRDREVDVLRLLADGLDTAEIAQRLCYSEWTVKDVLYALLTRLQLQNRQQAVAYAIRAGLI